MLTSCGCEFSGDIGKSCKVNSAFPTDFHSAGVLRSFRQAFAQREKRVKYAASGKSVPARFQGLLYADPELKEKGKMSAPGTAREESQSMEFSVTKIGSVE